MKKLSVKFLLITFLLSMPVFSEARAKTEAQPPETLLGAASEYNQIGIGIGRRRSRRRSMRRNRRVRRHIRARRNARRDNRSMRRRSRRGRSGHDH